MCKNIAFSLPIPPSLNTYYRKGWHGNLYISKKGLLYRRLVCEACGPLPKFGKALVKVEIIVTQGDKRWRDVDGLFKCLLDALTKSGIIDDDRYIDDLKIKRARHKNGELIVNKASGFVTVSMCKLYGGDNE